MDSQRCEQNDRVLQSYSTREILKELSFRTPFTVNGMEAAISMGFRGMLRLPQNRKVDFLDELAEKCAVRGLEWRGGEPVDIMYSTVELAGEVGELCNAIKKQSREAKGMVGTRVNRQDVEDEFGDVMVCLSILAGEMGINLEDVTRRKFNKTSEKYNLETKINAS